MRLTKLDNLIERKEARLEELRTPRYKGRAYLGLAARPEHIEEIRALRRELAVLGAIEETLHPHRKF